jgi:hypothetical protein
VTDQPEAIGPSALGRVPASVEDLLIGRIEHHIDLRPGCAARHARLAHLIGAGDDAVGESVTGLFDRGDDPHCRVIHPQPVLGGEELGHALV